MDDCIFCKLANGVIPTDMVYQDELCACFRDVAPQAPTHMLLVPKVHIMGIEALEPEHKDVVAHMMLKVRELTEAEGLENGFRVVINAGEDGGQTVPHMHLHILGKRAMQWPPG